MIKQLRGRGDTLGSNASKKCVLMTSPWRPRSSGEGDNGSGEWKRARQEMRDLVKTELTASSPKVVLVDDNNYYRSMRHEYYQLARDMGVGFCQIFMQVTIFCQCLRLRPIFFHKLKQNGN